MTKILVRNVKWLQFIGIVTTIDNYGVPDSNPDRSELIAADFRIFRHALLAFVILVPQVVKIWLLSENMIIFALKLQIFFLITDCLYVSADC